MYSLVVRLAACAGALAAIIWIAAGAVVPSGELTVATNLHEPAPYLSPPKPTGRVASPIIAANGKERSPLTGDPIYLDLTPPSSFETVTMTVDYANSGHPMIELGALGSALDGQFDMRPAEARLIDSLAWTRVFDGGLTLLQRSPKYRTLADFFADPPDAARVAAYAVETPLRTRLQDYVPAGDPRTIEVSLRGQHRLFTYVQGEPLSFSFFVQDMNREKGADPVIVSVYKSGARSKVGAEPAPAVSRTILEDDGNAKSDQKSSKLRVISVSLTDPEDGVYQIEFTAPNDVFIRRIVTRQSKLVFADKLYLGDKVGYSDKVAPVTVFADGRKLVSRTAHLESLQTIAVAGAKVAVDEPHTRYISDLSGSRDLAAVTVPKLDLLLESDGVFALRRDDFFNPFPLHLQWYDGKTVLDRRGIDYVLTSYRPPENVAVDLRRANATFKLAALAKTEEGAYRFALAVPGIGETQQEVRVERVAFTLRRPPLGWRNVWQRLVALFTPVPTSTEVMSGGKTFGEAPQ